MSRGPKYLERHARYCKQVLGTGSSTPQVFDRRTRRWKPTTAPEQLPGVKASMRVVFAATLIDVIDSSGGYGYPGPIVHYDAAGKGWVRDEHGTLLEHVEEQQTFTLWNEARRMAPKDADEFARNMLADYEAQEGPLRAEVGAVLRRLG